MLCVKKIFISKFSESHEKIKELLENLIPESVIVNSQYVNFRSLDINIKLLSIIVSSKR